MCFPDPEDMKVKIVLRAASKGVNTVFIGYDSAHARPFLKLKELLAAEKHVSCNIQYQEYIRDKSVQPRIRTVNHILQE